SLPLFPLLSSGNLHSLAFFTFAILVHVLYNQPWIIMVSSISTSHLKSTLTDRQISRTNKNMTSMSKFKTMTSGMTLVLKKFRMLRRRM
ncbi:hypothetical protein LINPERPRIM_LOCUS37189, partial [Linum perenne]